jgi:hypothetical protein
VIEMSIECGAIVLRKAGPVRVGWAEDRRALAAQPDVGLVWPEFSNLADADIVW